MNGESHSDEGGVKRRQWILCSFGDEFDLVLREHERTSSLDCSWTEFYTTKACLDASREGLFFSFLVGTPIYKEIPYGDWTTGA